MDLKGIRMAWHHDLQQFRIVRHPFIVPVLHEQHDYRLRTKEREVSPCEHIISCVKSMRETERHEQNT